MKVFTGTLLDSGDRNEALSHYRESEVDAEFLPYLVKINQLPFVVTVQCCLGHMSYDKWEGPEDDLPIERTDSWGYLLMMATVEAAEWISDRSDFSWLWVQGSQLFVEGAGMPALTENESYFIALAWDHKWWPTSIEEIFQLLSDFYNQQLSSD